MIQTPDNIYGYEVSAAMRKVWQVELEILRQFMSVCENNGLQYKAIAGTLLGAVRHKGFIPWDNDIDIVMPRKDYNKLLAIGEKSFPDPFFFQTPETENSRFFCQYIKIRHSNSTAISQCEKEYNINGGIFIDVFCLDELPDCRIQRKLFIWKLNEIAKMQRFALAKPLHGGAFGKIKHTIQRFVYRRFFHSPDAGELFKIYNNYAGKFAGKGCKEVTTLEFGYRKNIVWCRIDWEESMLLDFEDLKLPAPKGYDAVLKKQYGDYWCPPKNKETHEYYEFDPDTPYKQYI